MKHSDINILLSEAVMTSSESINVQGAHERCANAGAFLLDVRGFDEYAAGHAHEARCIPLPDLERRCGELPTDRPVLIMCQSGGRSQMAAERLRALGFDNIVDVEGGFDAWTKHRLPTLTRRGVIPLERQVRGIAGMLVLGFTLAALIGAKWLLAVPVFVGFMLFLSGVTGLCPMLSILKRMPWNRPVAGADTVLA